MSGLRAENKRENVKYFIKDREKKFPVSGTMVHIIRSNPVSVESSSQEYFFSSLDGILVHRIATLGIECNGTHYSPGCRGTVRVKCLTQNTKTQARAQTWTALSCVHHANHYTQPICGMVHLFHYSQLKMLTKNKTC